MNDDKYEVMVDDNYHYMDEDERYSAGTFDTCEAAVAECKKIVDEFLLHTLKGNPNMTAEELLKGYKGFGEDPWIRSSDPNCMFSAWTYAEERCKELCASASATNDNV